MLVTPFPDHFGSFRLLSPFPTISVDTNKANDPGQHEHLTLTKGWWGMGRLRQVIVTDSLYNLFEKIVA